MWDVHSIAVQAAVHLVLPEAWDLGLLSNDRFFFSFKLKVPENCTEISQWSNNITLELLTHKSAIKTEINPKMLTINHC